MIAYNQTWLTNLRLQAVVKDDLSKGRINAIEFKAIAEKYPAGFFTPGAFARIGLFIVTCIVVAFADGLIALMASSSNVLVSPGFPIFLGLLSYAGLELIVNVNKHYRSGVDDALLFTTGCLFLTGLFMLFSTYNNDSNYVALCGMAFILSAVFTLRFADMLMSVACCVSFFAFVYFTWTSFMSFGMATAPFAMMLVSVGAYWLICANRAKYINYENGITVGQIVCLVTLYLAGNYYIIQSLSDQLHGQVNSPIPFGAFFWAWTILVPFVYIGFGIKKKDAILLRTGLLLVTAAALTFRNYYHILPLDVTLTIVGAILLGIAYSIMRYLKTSKHGFTYAEPDEENMMDHLKVESLLVAESFSTAPSAPTDSGTKFGGGDFGGGGSSSGF
jgi:hypothetical protein